MAGSSDLLASERKVRPLEVETCESGARYVHPLFLTPLKAVCCLSETLTKHGASLKGVFLS